jgi:hypothetical protein
MVDPFCALLLAIFITMTHASRICNNEIELRSEYYDGSLLIISLNLE